MAANAEKLHLLGVKNVVITYGDKGSYISTKDIETLIPAYKVEATDTTGAGDTFIGYLASNLNRCPTINSYCSRSRASNGGRING